MCKDCTDARLTCACVQEGALEAMLTAHLSGDSLISSAHVINHPSNVEAWAFPVSSQRR